PHLASCSAGPRLGLPLLAGELPTGGEPPHGAFHRNLRSHAQWPPPWGGAAGSGPRLHRPSAPAVPPHRALAAVLPDRPRAPRPARPGQGHPPGHPTGGRLLLGRGGPGAAVGARGGARPPP